MQGRGSRRFAGGMNLNSKDKEISNIINKETNHDKHNPLIGHKGGFFFAMKMKKYANLIVSKLESRRYASLRSRHLHFFNDKTIIPNEESGVFMNPGHAIDSDE